MSLIAALRRAIRHGATHLAQGCTQVLLITGSAGTLAQTPPSPAASAPIAEHVKRAAERPFYWIKRNAQTPEAPASRVKSPPRPAAKSPPTDGTTAAPPLPARVSGITERVMPVFESPPLATSAPSSSDIGEGLNATLENSPPAAGQATANTPPREPSPAPPIAGTAANVPAPSVLSVTQPPPDSAALGAASLPKLQLLSQVEPEFPGFLQRRLRQGSVEVAFTVLPDGSVSAPSVLRSSHPLLDAPALEAVAQWRFAPIDVAKPGVVVLGFDLD